MAARDLEGELRRAELRGWDPFDALSSPLLRRLAWHPRLRQLMVQALKRAPVNVRPLLGIRRVRHTKAVALCVSAAARQPSPAPDLLLLVECLMDQAVETPSGVAWAYDFDVQTRWGYYRAGQPNAVATAFGAHALLDAFAVAGDQELVDAARSACGYAANELLVEEGAGSFYGYFAGSRVPIHNASALLAAATLRCMPAHGTECEAARAALAFTVERQRPDGSWPYGENAALGWVDGFHTAYILRCLAWSLDARPDESIETALDRGLAYYLERLFDEDGAPRASPEARYPIDIHAASSAIWVLSDLHAVSAEALPVAGRVLDWTLAHMLRRDGRFAYTRGRWLRSAIPYVRWSDAHMLLGLAAFLNADADHHR